MRYSANYNQMTANKIDVVESVCEEYSQEVLRFSNVTDSGICTPQNDPIIFVTSPTLTLFGDSDFLLFEEADAFLGLEDDPDSPKINPFYYDPEGDILLLEAILNSEPSPPPPNQEQNMPLFKEELKAYEAQTVKSSVDEPPEVELKDLPHHLEYAFLEGDNKFPVIIAKELGSEEKATLIKERPGEAFLGINLYHPSIKILLTNKDKLCELARTPLIEHCSAVLLKKLLEKLGDPGKFLILCDFLGMAECLALADLGASNNLMPLSTWNKLSFPDFSPTCMTLELADRLISRPVGVAEDVYVKTERALIDVFKGELILRVGKEAITFNLDQTSRHSTNYNDMIAKCIDVIDMACEEYSYEVLGFSDMIASGNPTPYYDPIVSTTSMTLTPFENSDFLLEEVDAFLALEDDPTSPKVDQSYLELKNCEAKSDKSSIDEPPEVELKDLPPYLEYAFLEGNDKLPVFIAKDMSMEEKTTLITVLKSHKRAIAWKLSDIKGIDPEFCTHKILMEEDFEPAPSTLCTKKGGFIVVENEENELILTRLVMGWRVCIDYRKLNESTRKDHFPLPFKEQMLERLAGNQYYYFLDGFSGYFQISIDPNDQVKTAFTCPYITFSYCRMPFGLCNAPGTFLRCMMAIFYDMIEKTMEVFMDDFSVFENSFQSCLSHLEKMLKRCEDTNLCLNWEKSHFMVKEGIVLDHKISKEGIEVDKAKVDVITK
uniref:Reverse transcriptase domain-containing protein n=1 Tax=Tanacetum cinerariifolium TaxID=118510 RepID=A0A699JHX9_TANCI|nr:reverse transcriptase domain-containing protein [Tanacetum cinerariifolium]